MLYLCPVSAISSTNLFSGYVVQLDNCSGGLNFNPPKPKSAMENKTNKSKISQKRLSFTLV